MSFFQENVLLIGLALGSGLALIWPMLSGGGAGAVAISVTEAVLLMNRNKPLILDVRDEAEFAQGHLVGAKNIPVANLAARVAELQKHQDKPVLVYCQSGMRAKTACSILKGQQFSQLRVIRGAWSAWQEANMPIEKRLSNLPLLRKRKRNVKLLMPSVLMYTSAVCPYCINAERLLRSAG